MWYDAFGGKGAAQQTGNVADLNVDEFFQDTEGTFVLKDLESGKVFIYNQDRAQERRTPMSTFKIMNSLIGLQVKAVKDEYDVKRWDGIQRPSALNQDLALGSAYKYSAVYNIRLWLAI